MVKCSGRRNISEVSIVLCGQAGQGIQTVEFLLTRILKIAGYHVFATKEYMSRVRGGANSTTLRVASGPVRALVDRIDILVALDAGAIRHVQSRLSADTVILADSEAVGAARDDAYKVLDVPFTKTAVEIGNKVYSNVVAVGTLAGLLSIELNLVTDYVRRFFSGKSGDIVENNLKAVNAGYGLGIKLSTSLTIKFELDTDKALGDRIVVNGAEAVGLGAIAGGCNFVSAYPMSPSTNVLVFLANHAHDFGIVVEQAEDEIAAINMAIGAWYAGARAMVTTSGGGFALMTEGLSLAAMLESPLVIHLAQRPGPATGLPTRTEQADLEMALYAGHGEFPRIILAPGSIEDAFYLTQKAFNLADKYQVPVFILTDQYLVDSYYDMPNLDLAGTNIEKHFIETTSDYRRYELTDSGISPRGIPGFGAGLVAVDSDEHDAGGHITEDLDLRIRMVDKRLRKADAMAEDAILPELVGPKDYKILIVGWGSTYNVVAEALQRIDRNDAAFLHFKQVHPLHPRAAEFLNRAERTIIVENNATCQLGRLIKIRFGFDIKDRILKYNGLGFAVEEVVMKLNRLLSLR
jgi:2-oxoglutarate ferredoxin oxidoreductase subunit alpha